MRNQVRAGAIAVTALMIVLPLGCVPFLADHQSARLLPEGTLEITPSVSYVSFSSEGESEHLQTHFGARIAYGMAPRVELRGIFEHVAIEDVGTGEISGTNLVGFGPKFGLVPDRISLYAPLGFVTGGGAESGDSWTFAPTLIARALSTPNFELVPAVKAFVPLGGDGRDLLIGFHLGAGLSSDMNRWAIRPEIGFVRNPGEDGTAWGGSLGLSLRR